MSWLFSQALVEEFSEVTSWGGEPSAQLNVMPTPHKFWRNDKTMEPFQLSRFGLTCAVLTEDHGAALLTWFREDFLARTSVQQEKGLASQVSVPACGEKWHGWWARFDRASCSWRTPQCSLLEDSELYSETWPRSGLMLDGQCFPLPNAEPDTSVSAYGLWPTPNAMKATWDLKLACSGDGRSTPNKLGWALAAAGEIGEVNPEWGEWLMLWPIGWTGLKPLATDKSHFARQKHSSDCLPTSCEAL